MADAMAKYPEGGIHEFTFMLLMAKTEKRIPNKPINSFGLYQENKLQAVRVKDSGITFLPPLHRANPIVSSAPGNKYQPK